MAGHRRRRGSRDSGLLHVQVRCDASGEEQTQGQVRRHFDRRPPDTSLAHTAKRLEPDQISYLHGKRLREYAPEELGRFRLITDVMGGFSYAADLSLFIEKTLDVLATDGSFFTVLQDVRSEHRTNSPYYPDAPFLTEIVATDGTEITMCAWLKRIKCAEVSCEFKKDMQPPIEVYRIHKTCNETLVPKLTMVHFQAGTPPERRFRLVHSAPRADP